MSAKTGTKKMSGKKLALIISLSVIGVIIIFCIIIGAIANKIVGSMGASVDVVNPTTSNISSTVSTSGLVSSGDVTSYTSPVSASVSEVNVKIGQTVKKGDTIITFDTSDLEDQYTQASLSAKSTSLSNQSTIDNSNKTSSDIDKAKTNVTNLKSQIATLEQEITTLQGSYADDGTEDLYISLSEKRATLATVLSEIQTIIETNPEGTNISSNPTYTAKIAERDALTAEITNLENIIAATPSANAQIDAAISQKYTELAELKAQLSTQESIVENAEAGLLTSTQREQLNVTNQLSSLQVEAAATSLEEGKAGIVADKNGIITSLDVMKGSTTAPGMQVYTIADTNSIKVSVSLSKRDLESVALGQTATVTILNKEYEGEVTYISKVASTSANGATTIEAEISITNPDDSIIIGLDAKVVINTASLENVLTVPNMSVNADTEGVFVYIVKDNLIAKQYVTIGISDMDNTEITDGLTFDDMVITSVSATTIEGMPVNPILPTDTELDTKNNSK